MHKIIVSWGNKECSYVEELVELVNKITSEKCEKQHLELKKASGGTPSRLYDTLSSFSNQIGGGIIILELTKMPDIKL